MADVQPLRALHYDLGRVGPLQPSPPRPTTSSTPAQRAELAARSPYNVVADRPAAGTRAATPTSTPPSLLDALDAPRARRPRRPSPRSGRSRRTTPAPDGRAAHAPRLLRARARRGLRPRPHPPARAHAPGPEGGPAAPHARDAGEPLPDLHPLRRPRRRGVGRAGAAPRRRAVGRGDRRRRHASTGCGGSPTPTAIARRAARARARRAADRRRPPPLRDRARLRRGGRRRGRAPLRAHVPGRAQDPGLTVFPTHRLVRGSTRPRRRRLARRSARDFEIERDRPAELAPPPATDRCSIGYMDATPAPVPAHAQGPGDRRRRAGGHSRSPTAGSTPPCSRRCCSRARSA